MGALRENSSSAKEKGELWIGVWGTMSADTLLEFGLDVLTNLGDLARDVR